MTIRTLLILSEDTVCLLAAGGVDGCCNERCSSVVILPLYLLTSMIERHNFELQQVVQTCCCWPSACQGNDSSYLSHLP